MKNSELGHFTRERKNLRAHTKRGHVEVCNSNYNNYNTTQHNTSGLPPVHLVSAFRNNLNGQTGHRVEMFARIGTPKGGLGLGFVHRKEQKKGQRARSSSSCNERSPILHPVVPCSLYENMLMVIQFAVPRKQLSMALKALTGG